MPTRRRLLDVTVGALIGAYVMGTYLLWDLPVREMIERG